MKDNLTIKGLDHKDFKETWHDMSFNWEDMRKCTSCAGVQIIKKDNILPSPIDKPTMVVSPNDNTTSLLIFHILS